MSKCQLKMQHPSRCETAVNTVTRTPPCRGFIEVSDDGHRTAKVTIFLRIISTFFVIFLDIVYLVKGSICCRIKKVEIIERKRVTSSVLFLSSLTSIEPQRRHRVCRVNYTDPATDAQRHRSFELLSVKVHQNVQNFEIINQENLIFECNKSPTVQNIEFH